MFSPVTIIFPAFPVLELTSIVPEFITSPLFATTSTFPNISPKLFASITPVLFTTPFSNSLTALVVKNTSPPSAKIVPEFLTIASRTPLFTTRFTNEFPFKLIEYSFAPTR